MQNLKSRFFYSAAIITFLSISVRPMAAQDLREGDSHGQNPTERALREEANNESPIYPDMTSNFIISQNTLGMERLPVVSPIGSNGKLVAWANHNGDWGLQAISIDPSGQAIHSEFFLTDTRPTGSAISSEFPPKDPPPPTSGVSLEGFTYEQRIKALVESVIRKLNQIASNLLEPPIWDPEKITIEDLRDLQNLVASYSAQPIQRVSDYAYPWIGYFNDGFSNYVTQPTQRVGRYAYSWVSPTAWSRSFNSVARSLSKYAKCVSNGHSSYSAGRQTAQIYVFYPQKSPLLGGNTSFLASEGRLQLR